VVDRHGVPDVHRLYRDTHAVKLFLKLELRCLYADDHQPLARILVRPRPAVRGGPDPVDALVRAEAAEDDPPLQGAGGDRFRVHPGGGPVEYRQLSFDGEFIAMAKHHLLRSARGFSCDAMSAWNSAQKWQRTARAAACRRLD